MNKKTPLNVDDAYALETPDDSIRLYGDWAESYDADFVTATGYVVYSLVADQLLRSSMPIGGPVLDIGCGTGAVGVCLREGGIKVVDGVDISQPMLAEAGKKRTVDGESVYRNLIAADLTRNLDIPDNRYAALVSAGTFTHGHLGPGSLDELWRVAAAGARCAIGIRTTHFGTAGFERKLAVDVDDGKITQPELVEVNMYSAESDNPQHANDKAYIVLCSVVK